MRTVKDLVKLLGLEVGEEFYIYDNYYKEQYSFVHKFSHHNLLYSDNSAWRSSNRRILDFFTGRYTIIKKPWKPKFNDRYYYVTFRNSGNIVDNVRWNNDIFDYSSYVIGNCFRTEEEAEEHKEEIINYLKSIYEKGNTLCDIK